LLNALRSADLALDLLTGPTCRIDGSGLEFAVLASILDHLGKPLCAVVGGELSMRESISKVTEVVSVGRRKGRTVYSPNNTHGSSHQSITPILI
jgi:hypothetical protein